jgi:hypothetical protein
VRSRTSTAAGLVPILGTGGVRSESPPASMLAPATSSVHVSPGSMATHALQARAGTRRPRVGTARVLQGRRKECEVFDRLFETVRRGESRVLVVRGEPGVGKSALLEYAVESASGLRVVRAAGVESEMELAFAGLHQLVSPMLDHVGGLPVPQRDALGTAFGLTRGPAPDRFLLSLAVLGLVSEVAEERPLVCLVDDAQWLDRESAQVLEFVARRMVAESVGLVFAARQAAEEQPLAGLPELLVEGLPDGDARALLALVISWPLDEAVRDRIIAETRGNPLALLELPRRLTPAEMAGGFGLPDAQALSSRIEDSFQRRVRELPVETQRLLLVAAAEPIGEPALVRRAACRLGIGVDAADAAASEGLLQFDPRVTFRHPLERSSADRPGSAARCADPASASVGRGGGALPFDGTVSNTSSS